MSKPDLKQLAIDYRAGCIFTDRQCQTPEEIRMVFLVIAFMDHDSLTKMIETEGMIYEYLSEAGPRSCNGLPMFFSMRTLPKTDVPLFAEWVQKLAAAEAAA